MFSTRPVPDATHFVWVFVFALGIAGVAILFRHLRPQGYPWWARILFLMACMINGHAFQAATSLRGIPGMVDSLLFPLIPGALSNDYSNRLELAGGSWRDSHWREALERGNQLGLIHGLLVWFTIAALIFAWCWLRPARAIRYGDDPPVYG